MSSRRKQIRQDIVTRLKAAVPEVSNRVFPSRATALGDVELPAICVFTREETVETISDRPVLQLRRLALGVEIQVNGSGLVDETLDDIAEKVEQELLKDEALAPASGLYLTIEQVGTEMGFFAEKKLIAAARLTFAFSYEQTFT